MTGANAKIKRIMIGDKQVRPYRFEYSYDFRNKSTTQLANDGWMNTSGLTTGSDGITSSSWVAVRRQLSGLATAMSTAKHFKLELTSYLSDTDMCTSGLLLTEDTNNTRRCGFYYDEIGFSYGINAVEISRTTHQKSVGSKYIMMEFDLLNKTYSGNYVGGNGAFSGTLTDTQISSIRNLGYINMPLQSYSYIQTIKVTVE